METRNYSRLTVRTTASVETYYDVKVKKDLRSGIVYIFTFEGRVVDEYNWQHVISLCGLEYKNPNIEKEGSK